MLPENTTLIDPESRDSFGQYNVNSGSVLVFPFSVDLLGNVELITQHTKLNSQDFSLDLWISSSPLDGLMLQEGLGHLKLNRDEETRVIFDSFLKTGDEDTRLFLPSGTTLYVNVRNLQNSPNTFLLEMLENPGTPVNAVDAQV